MSNLIEISQQEDYSLINRFLSGENEGFEMLVKKYQNYVVNIVYSLTGQSYYADDIAQEVFIKVYQNLSSFGKKAAFSTWLYRIVVNTAYNYLKSKKRYVSLEHIDKEVDYRKISLLDLENKEKQQMVRKAIGKLPFKYRTVLVLKDMEGFSYIDIAKTLNCSIGTVESRLSRARSLLKKTLLPLIKKDGET